MFVFILEGPDTDFSIVTEFVSLGSLDHYIPSRKVCIYFLMRNEIILKYIFCFKFFHDNFKGSDKNVKLNY